MQFVGRSEQRQRITQLASAAHEGALLVVAGHGMGKSWLLEVAQAESATPCVLIHSMSSEASWPLSGYFRVVGVICDALGIDPSGIPSSPLGHLGTHSDAAVAGINHYALARELPAALRAASAVPLLVLIDDIDRMDSDSQKVLGFTVDAIAGTGLRLVVTAAATRLTALAGFAQLRLDPLSTTECRELAMALAGPSSDAGTVHFLAVTAAGSPGVVEESLRSLVPPQIQGRDPLVLPLRTKAVGSAAIEASLVALSPEERAMLAMLSLGPFTSAFTVESGNDTDALESLLSSGLIVQRSHRLSVGEPGMRSHLYWSMLPRLRRELHLAMAEAHRIVEPPLLLWHTSFARADDDDVAALLAAAAQLAGSGNSVAAIEFAERALFIARSIGDHVHSVLDVATAFLGRMEFMFAARYLGMARREATTPEHSIRLTSLRVNIEYAMTNTVLANDVDAAVSLFSANNPEATVELLATASAFHAERWEVAEARRYLDWAGDLAREHALQPIESLHAVEMLLQSLDGVPPGTTPPPEELVRSVSTSSPIQLIMLGEALMYREEYARARHLFTIVLNHPRQPPLLWLESALVGLAINEIRSGSFHRARAAIEQWLALAPVETTERSSRMALRAWYLRSSGAVEDSDILFDRCLKQLSRQNHSAVAATIFTLRGTFAVVDGNYDAAARLLDSADVVGHRLTNPALLRHQVSLVEAYVATGRMSEARAVVERLQERAVSHPSRWITLALARGRALVAPDSEKLAAFGIALDAFDANDSAYELGLLLTNLAAAQAWLGFGPESERSYTAARNALGNAGAYAWVTRSTPDDAESLPSGSPTSSPVHPSPSAWDGFTHEELLIIEKIRQGYRNKEIAASMYISLRTVELRLTTIYRKVGARSRSHLAALLQ